MERFEVQVEQLAGALVIRPVGEADYATASTWRAQMLTALDGLTSGAPAGQARTDPGGTDDLDDGHGRPQLRVILDLTELTFMDSSGLQVLVTGFRHAVRAGAYCCVAGAQPSVASRMSVAGLTPYIPFHPTLAEALGHR
jgi:stage II sporulation protein AA (anti-sigma F factor antagonist)